MPAVSTVHPSTSPVSPDDDAREVRPRIAPRPARVRHSTSLWRLRTYLYPYGSRYLVMAVAAIAGVALSMAIPLMTQRVIDGPIARADQRGLLVLGTVAVAIGITEAVVLFLRRWIVALANNGSERLIRTDLYAKLQSLPMSFHGRWQSGQLLSRMMTDLSIIRRFLGFGMLFLVVNIVQIAVVVVLLLNLYWPLGIVVALSIIPVAWLCLVNEKRFTRLSRKIQDEQGDVASAVEEGVHGLRVIKSFGRFAHLYSGFERRTQQLYETSMDRVKLSSRFLTFLEVIPTCTMIIVLGMGAIATARGDLTIGTLVAFITLLLSLIWPVAALGFLLAMTQEAMTAADRLAEILDAESPLVDGTKVLEAPRGHLRFEHVGFRFDDADQNTLTDVNLDIAPGETIALVGGTGAGKTTMTALVSRLVDVTEGRITLDGVDIRELRIRHLRRLVATAFEDPTLFSMSARENLALGRSDASDADIEQAIDIAQAHFVHDLPWGLDTRIGEQGMSLSGGQRQRLALARAVLVNPTVLVLDDTLSALDIHTEALVEEALKRVLADVTGIVVAHRASTVLLADRVAVLSQGTIVAVGTHSELLATSQEYRELMSADFDAEVELEECGSRPHATDGHRSGARPEVDGEQPPDGRAPRHPDRSGDVRAEVAR
ncbi:ATP-binding cassette domain-containing protein [Auraticoccus sp. F435]|uniref:ATP-binding cassette domain-containing protein n=1 Tax=Auraticoccus cholistanensis TaxID=2656650 RepID=A0A6A9USV9_9ACTN|nr:ABC transporter ATP-binding protein [Auraticoccus cholistanensis]MVA74762.1 ATP-binding cassette domain-containing protein [Auraticoccus cholistanensis]